MKQLLTNSFLLLFAIVYTVSAVEPNSVKTTTYGVGMDHDVSLHMSSVSYVDGLGRAIQAKDSISGSSDRVVCTFYDEAGRQKNTTKPFIDEVFGGSFLPGDLSDPNIGDSLESNYDGEPQAYSETDYWDDPLGRVKKAIGPGTAHVNEYSRSWTIGVALQSDTTYTVDCSNGGGSGNVDVKFNNAGFIEEIAAGTVTEPFEVIFDALYAQFLDDNPFTTPTHFLNIVRDPEENISQELKDLFGRTLETFVCTDLENPASASTETITGTYQYDIVGNVLKEIPPDDNGTKLIDDTEYKYNSLGQLIWKKTPDGGEFTYTYTPDGQIDTVKSMVNNSGTIEVVRMLSYDYDELGRLVHIQNWNTTAGTYDVVLKNFYDTGDDIVHINFFQVIPKDVRDRLRNLKGRLAGRYNMASGNASYEIGELFSYDDEGRLENRIMVINNSDNWQSTAYQYDLHGKVTSEIFHYAGDVIAKEYRYDRFGRLDTIYHHEYDPAQNALINKQPIATYTYDDMRGTMTSKKFDRITQTYTVDYDYDILDRITAMNNTQNSGFTEDSIAYSAAGNIDSVNYKYMVGGTLTRDAFVYSYDNLYRLTAATRNNAAYGSYSYDNLGRFSSKVEDTTTVNTYQYYTGTDGNTNRLKSTSRNPAGTAGYIYDKHGNMVIDLSKNMLIRYDWRDMPIEYLFYDNLGSVTFSTNTNTAGTWDGATDLYEYVAQQSVNLESTVTMLYDADGNRVCKLEEKM